MRVNVIDVQDKIKVHYFYLNHSLISPPHGMGFHLIFPSSIPEAPDSKGYLSEGLNKNSDNERRCLNLQFKGTALAIPKKCWESRTSPYRAAPGFSNNITFLENRYRKTSSTWSEWRVGPVFIWDRFTSYSYKRPNLYSDTWSQEDYAFQAWRSGNKLTIHLSGKYRLRKSEPWSFVDIKVSHIVYPNQGKVVTENGYPQIMDTIYSSVDTSSLRKIQLPSSRAGLENVHLRLVKRVHNYPDLNLVYGDLVRRCANDAVVVPCNTIELITELRTIGETFKSLFMLTQGKVDAKKIASGYLQYKYGLRLTVHDLKVMSQGIVARVMRTRSDKSRSRARETFSPQMFSNSEIGDLTIACNYKINYYTNTDDWRDGLRVWFNSGSFPSLTNAWDLIPLSFVADWFLSVESYLNAIDANTYWSLYAISSTVYSVKETYHDVGQMFSNSDYTLTGDISFVYYNRQVSGTVHKPVFFDPSPREFRNYAELTSLLVANQ